MYTYTPCKGERQLAASTARPGAVRPRALDGYDRDDARVSSEVRARVVVGLDEHHVGERRRDGLAADHVKNAAARAVDEAELRRDVGREHDARAPLAR
jgi:hypothetical protein